MGSVGALILFSILGSVICAKARVAGGAIVFALIALTLFVSTPAGQALPRGGGRVRVDRGRRGHAGADRPDHRAGRLGGGGMSTTTSTSDTGAGTDSASVDEPPRRGGADRAGDLPVPAGCRRRG